MNKSDYDKYYKKGGTYVIPVEVFNELFDELERLSFNYEQALEDLDKKENIINELEHDFESYELEYLQDTYQGSLADFIETELERIKELKGSESDE